VPVNSNNLWNRRRIGRIVGAVLCVYVQCTAVAAEKETRYPHVNAATWYLVDPTWPQYPKDVPRAGVPSVAIDKAGCIWAFTRSNLPVQVYDADGKFVRGWGENAFENPHGLRLAPDGSVWLTDVDTHIVMQFTPDGKLLRTFGTRGVPGCDRTHFNAPTDMAITPTGDVFVSDGYGNNRIVHFDRDGRFIKSWGKLGSKPGEFSIPHAIVRDSKGRLYVADRNNVRIQVFDGNGKFLDEWRNLLVPWGLCVGENDEIWACGSSPAAWACDQVFLGFPPKDQLVMRFAPSGKLLALWTIPKGVDGKERPGEVNGVHGIAVDSHGNIYLGDITGNRIQKFVKQDTADISGK
jgi:DNA-binding beta-propeller fold protein YncE